MPPNRESGDGNVPDKQWSNFYGLGEERTSIEVLKIYGAHLSLTAPATSAHSREPALR